jgi:hypothetical protein
MEQIEHQRLEAASAARALPARVVLGEVADA